MIGFEGAQGCIVAVTVPIAVRVLAALFGEIILLVRPSVSVLVWAAIGRSSRGCACFVWTGIAVGSGRFITVSITIAVKPLRTVAGPEIAAIACSVSVVVKTTVDVKR